MASSEHGLSIMSYELNRMDSATQLSSNTPSDQPNMSSSHGHRNYDERMGYFESGCPGDGRFGRIGEMIHVPAPGLNEIENPGRSGRYPESSQRTCLQEDRSGNPMPVGGIYYNEAGDVHGQVLIASPSDHMHLTDRNGSRHPSDLYPPTLDNTPSPTSRSALPSLAERVGKVAVPHGHVPTHSSYQPDSMSYGPSILPLSGSKVSTGISSGLPNLTIFEAQYQESQHGSELSQMDSGDHITTTNPRPQNLVIDNVCGLSPSTLSSIPMSNSPVWSQSQPLASSNAFGAQPCNPIMGASLIGNSSASSIPESDSALSVPSISSEHVGQAGKKKKKKSKMHGCETCGKYFPRPSGLRTHMNIHSNAKPFACSYPGCTRTFGVRSNAKRHLRTHGINPSVPQDGDIPPYIVDFNTPIVSISQNLEHHQPNGGMQHQTIQPFFRLRWVPPSLAHCTNAASLKPVSPNDSCSEDENDSDPENAGLQSGGSTLSLLPIPLQAVEPTVVRLSRPVTFNSPSSSSSADSPSALPTPSFGVASFDANNIQYEERNSYAETGSRPYHPSQFCALPGPAPLRV